MASSRRTPIPYSGRVFSLDFCYTLTGRRYAEEFIETLRSDHPRELARLESNLWLLANEGRISNPQKFKHLHHGIFEVKGDAARVFLYFHDPLKLWFLVDGVLKKRSNIPRSIIDRVERLRAEHLASLE
jgi:hypothetical protein